ncbi:hypothetical protein NECID01_0892 [Nematocida sp. AWRm77]|nr:hypothetical protein NECID01_0892 [Nematocida sp. AWRm77]
MSATLLLCDILKSFSSVVTVIHGAEKELRFSGIKNGEMHISVGKSTVHSTFTGTVGMRTADFLKVLKETKFFGDVEFDLSSKTLQVTLEEGECALSLACQVFQAEYRDPPSVSAQILCSVDVSLVKDISTTNLRTAEIFFGEDSIRLALSGSIKTEAEQRSIEYIKKETDKSLFILSSEAFSSVISLCQLSPHRVVIGAEMYLAVFYLYFKEVTVLVYVPGTLM